MEAAEFGPIIQSTAWEWRTRTREWPADSAVISRAAVLSRAMGLMPATEIMQAPAAMQMVEISGAGSRARKPRRP